VSTGFVDWRAHELGLNGAVSSQRKMIEAEDMSSSLTMVRTLSPSAIHSQIFFARTFVNFVGRPPAIVLGIMHHANVKRDILSPKTGPKKVTDRQRKKEKSI
jgi:hypothetical protein